MPTGREWRQLDRDRADQDLVQRAAARLRHDVIQAGYRGLSHLDQHMMFGLAELLDECARQLRGLDDGVRRQLVQSCRTVLGETMDDPVARRTRRRR